MSDYVMNDVGLIALRDDEKRAIVGGYVDPNVEKNNDPVATNGTASILDLIKDSIKVITILW